MKADKNFRLKKSTKRLIALMGADPVARNSFKRAMIDAQLCEESARRASLKSKEGRDTK